MSNIEKARQKLRKLYIKLFEVIQLYTFDYKNDIKQGDYYSKLISNIREEILKVPDNYVLEKKLIAAKHGAFYDDGIYDDKSLSKIGEVSDEFFSSFIHRLELSIPDTTGEMREKYL